MAILKKTDNENKAVIDLTSPKGNSFYLLGTAESLGTQLEFNTDKILKEMKSGDYENLILTFDKYFGDYIDLER